MDVNVSQNNWVSGELSPNMRGRYNLPVYAAGAERFVNFIPEMQGPMRFRNGTQFVIPTRRNKIACYIPFQFNDSQSYLLEFTDKFFRILRNNGVLVEGDKTISGWTAGTITATSHGYSDGDEVFIFGIVGVSGLNGKSLIISDKSTHTFKLKDNDGNYVSGTGTYISGGVAERIVEVVSPYAEADLFNLKYAQNADTMYITHHSYAPYKLVRTSALVWTLGTFSRTLDPFTGAGKYPSCCWFYESRLLYGATDDLPSTFWGSKTPTDAGVAQYDDLTTGTAAGDAFVFTIAPSSGKVEKIQWFAGTTRYFAIGTFGGVSKANGGDDNTALSPSTINVRPAVINGGGASSVVPVPLGNALLYLQRTNRILFNLEYDLLYDAFIPTDKNLVADHITYGGIKQMVYQNARPESIWMVRNDGVLLQVTYKTKENIAGWSRQVLGGANAKVLSVGVMPRDNDFDQIWVVVERTINGVTRRYNEYLNDQVVFPELVDFYTGGGNEAEDEETFGRAMFEAQKQSIHLDSALTYDGSDQAMTMTPGAVSGVGVAFTAGSAVFAATDVGRQIWKKAIKGVGTGRAKITAFVSSTEVTCTITVPFDATTAMAAGNWYLTTNRISGLEHLEGQSAGIQADGGDYGVETVTAGVVNLDYQVGMAHVGLGYRGLMKGMNAEAPGQTGPTSAKPKNTNKWGIRFLNTLGTKYGTSLYRMEQILFNSATNPSGRPSPLFSGGMILSCEDETAPEKHIFILQDKPLPCTVLNIDPFYDIDNN